MGSSVNGVDVVGKREYVFSISIVVLDSQFHVDRVFAGFEVNWRIVQNTLILVKMFERPFKCPDKSSIFIGAKPVLCNCSISVYSCVSLNVVSLFTFS